MCLLQYRCSIFHAKKTQLSTELTEIQPQSSKISIETLNRSTNLNSISYSTKLHAKNSKFRTESTKLRTSKTKIQTKVLKYMQITLKQILSALE